MRTVIIVLFFLCHLLIFGQQKYKSERNADIIEYTSRDGLPTSNISSVEQTPDGYIWIAGPQGTVRFDGYEFSYVGGKFGVPEMQAVYFDSLNSTLYFASPAKLILFKDGKFRVYDEKDGYRINGSPGRIISFIEGDSRGRIWIGAYTPFIDAPYNGGLTKFENGNFFAFDSSTFPLHNATGFVETPYGDIIFTSSGKNTQNGEEGYIALMRGNKFTRIDESTGFNLINPVAMSNRFNSVIDDDGNTWIAFYGNTDFTSAKNNSRSGVLMYDGAKFNQFPGLQKYLSPMEYVGTVFYSKNDEKIYTAFTTRNPKTFNSSSKEIFEFNKDHWIPSPIFKNIGNIKNIKSGEVIRDYGYTSLRFLDQGKTIPAGLLFNIQGPIASSANPSQYFAREGRHWKKYDYLPGVPILELQKGLLLSTSKGIAFYHPEESKMLREKDGLVSDDVGIPNFYVDRNQIVWMSFSYSDLPTYAEMNPYGMNLWDGKQLHKFTTEDGLASNVTYNVIHDREDRIWIATSGGVTKVREFKNTRGEWIFKFSNIDNSSGHNYSASSLLETSKDEIYAWQSFVRKPYGGLEGADFFLGRFNGKEFDSIKSPFAAELNRKPFQQLMLREEKNGHLWLEGLFAENVRDLTSVKTEIKIFDGESWYSPPETWNVPDKQLHFVGRLSNGSYYLTVGHFYKFNGERFIDLSDSANADADFKILKGASVAGTKTDIQVGDRLYIRLRGRGLVIFDGTHLKFYTPRDGLMATDIHDPMIDFRGNLFFASQVGAVMITGDKFRIYFDDQNIATGGPNSVTIDGEGNFIKYYNGIGLYIDQQKNSRINLNITEISVNEKKYFYRFPQRLDYAQNSLSFNFSVLNFDDPAETSFEYLLDGYDREWSRPSSRSFAEYQNLPSGNYTFNVRAKNSNGIASAETKFAFTINPPWWKTWWAYLFYIIAFLLFLYTVRKIELRRQLKNARIKESELKTKAAEMQAKAAEAQNRAIQAENERKTKELEEARALQLSLLPKDVPVYQNLVISTYMKTATEVGGDYYDFSFRKDGTLNVVIGDATGHGMKAGTLVTAMKALFSSGSTEVEMEPFFASVNTGLKKMQMERVMMGLAMLNFDQNKVKLINAGMPPILLYRKKTGEVEEIKEHGMPLGALEKVKYKTTALSLAAGDTLLLMTDGMPELQNAAGEMFGYERVSSHFKQAAEKSPEEIIEHLKKAGSQWVDDRDPDDDVTFVVVKLK